MKPPSLSVIVVTYRREQVLCDTLSHLLAQNYPESEILVVDQAPDHEPATRDFLRGVADTICYIAIDEVGICHARNVGIETARGDIIAFFDDDVIPAPNLIFLHARHYADPAVGGVTGPLHLDTAQARGPVRIVPGANVQRSPLPSEPVHADSVTGCNMSFRAAILRSIGGFDEGYIMMARREETDVSQRVLALGYRILFDPDARVEHLLTSTGGSRVNRAKEEQYAYGWYHNHAYYFAKHLPLWQLPLFLRYQFGPLLYRRMWQEKRTHLLHPALAGMSDGFRQGRRARRAMLAQLEAARSRL